MSTTKNPQNIKPFDWITVHGHSCVVCEVYPADSGRGVCQIVYNKRKPTTHDVDWDGKDWFFPERSDFGGYGIEGDPYVEQLKRGRNIPKFD